MSDTPETDKLWNEINEDDEKHDFDFAIMTNHSRKLERERDEALEQNAKLRDIAESAIKAIREARNLSVIGDWREIDAIENKLCAELKQIKGGAK